MPDILTPGTQIVAYPIETVPLPGEVTDIAAGDAGVWILDGSAGTVTRIDGPALGDPIRVGSMPSSIAVGLGAVWVSDGDGNLYRADPQLGTTEAIELGAPLGPIAIDDKNGAVWVGALEASGSG